MVGSRGAQEKFSHRGPTVSSYTPEMETPPFLVHLPTDLHGPSAKVCVSVTGGPRWKCHVKEPLEKQTVQLNVRTNHLILKGVLMMVCFNLLC